jgi:hypothetical protein
MPFNVKWITPAKASLVVAQAVITADGLELAW